MSIQTINLGNYANDGTGDDLRTAFEKVNANLVELFTSVYGANIGPLPPTADVDEGELWWDTVSGRLYIRYGSVWTDASPDTVTPPDPISDHTLSELSDVASTAPLTGQALVWNGTSWAPSDVSTAGPNLDFGSFTVPSSYDFDLGSF